MESIHIDSNYEQKNAIVELKNIHKTYLLGLEGVPALRYLEEAS